MLGDHDNVSNIRLSNMLLILFQWIYFQSKYTPKMTAETIATITLILKYISLYIWSINSQLFNRQVIIFPLLFMWGKGTSGTSFPRNRQRGSQPSFTLYTSSWSGGAFWRILFLYLIQKDEKFQTTFLTSSIWRSNPHFKISAPCKGKLHIIEVLLILGCFSASHTAKIFMCSWYDIGRMITMNNWT